MRAAGASLDQASVDFGHSNLTLRSLCLGTETDLANSPSDRIAIRLNRRQVEREAVHV